MSEEPSKSYAVYTSSAGIPYLVGDLLLGDGAGALALLLLQLLRGRLVLLLQLLLLVAVSIHLQQEPLSKHAPRDSAGIHAQRQKILADTCSVHKDAFFSCSCSCWLQSAFICSRSLSASMLFGPTSCQGPNIACEQSKQVAGLRVGAGLKRKLRARSWFAMAYWVI